MKYTVYANRYVSSNGNKAHVDTDWNEIVKTVTNKSAWPTFTATDKTIYDKEKEHFDAIVMAEMKPNTSRTTENVIAFYAIVLDVDNGATYDYVREDLCDYEYCIYSSGGTGLKEGDRFRVILPLKVPMAGSEWKRYNTSLTERFPYSDECFKKGIQIQYLPVMNTAYADQFIGEYHTGKYFDYQDTNDLPYVENLSTAGFTNNVTFDAVQFSDDEMRELAEAIINHQSGQLEYEERRLLAQRLKHIGMNDFDIVQVLDRVSKPGFTRPNIDIVKGANPQYARVEGLYKHIPHGMRIPAIERRIVRPIASESVTSKYNGEWTLRDGEYIDSLAMDMDFTSGINLLHADVGTGKTVFWTQQENVKFVAPLTSIVSSIGNGNSLTEGNVGTWNQIEGIINTRDKSVFKNQTLVIDECHGLYADYGYKGSVINRLMSMFDCFKSVVLMSGTVEAEHFSSIEFNKVYRVHKPSVARKNIRTFLTSHKDDVVLDHINSLTNKSIVLVNKKSLCKAFFEKINNKTLVVNADVKNDEEVLAFYKGKAMGEYDVILGTNSIVEGLSIEDKLEEVDIVIWGDISPERIEQFTNRFRNVCTTKNVWYFIDKKPVAVIEDYNRTEVMDDAKSLCKGLQALYESLTTDSIRRTFVNQYRNDLYSDMIYFHDGCFQLSLNAVDYDYSKHRDNVYSNDFKKFSERLCEFGFNVYSPVVLDGDKIKDAALKERSKEIKEELEAERVLVLTSLKDDIKNNKLLCSGINELYDSTYGSIEKLIDRGMSKDQVSNAIDGFIDDKKFFAKAHEDANDNEYGNAIIDLIKNEVQGKKELTSPDMQAIAQKIIDKQLVEYFNGDVEAMIKSKSWSGLVKKDSGSTYNSDSSILITSVGATAISTISLLL